MVFGGIDPAGGTMYVTVAATNVVGTGQGAAVLAAPDGTPVAMPPDSGVGIVTDGTPFVGGGYTGDGLAYSWQALNVSGAVQDGALSWAGARIPLVNGATPSGCCGV